MIDSVFVRDFQDIGDRIELYSDPNWILQSNQDHNGLPIFDIINADHNGFIASVTAEFFMGESNGTGRMDYDVTVAYDNDSLEVVNRRAVAFGQGSFDFIRQEN